MNHNHSFKKPVWNLRLFWKCLKHEKYAQCLVRNCKKTDQDIVERCFPDHSFCDEECGCDVVLVGYILTRNSRMIRNTTTRYLKSLGGKVYKSKIFGSKFIDRNRVCIPLKKDSDDHLSGFIISPRRKSSFEEENQLFEECPIPDIHLQTFLSWDCVIYF